MGCHHTRTVNCGIYNLTCGGAWAPRATAPCSIWIRAQCCDSGGQVQALAEPPLFRLSAAERLMVYISLNPSSSRDEGLGFIKSRVIKLPNRPSAASLGHIIRAQPDRHCRAALLRCLSIDSVHRSHVWAISSISHPEIKAYLD